jgi:hypothetical protein
MKTRSQTIESLKKEIEDQKKQLHIQKIQIRKLQNVLFIQTATERELDALRDLINWLIFDDFKGCKNITSLNLILKSQYKDPNFYYYENVPSIERHISTKIEEKKMSPYRVYVGIYNTRPSDKPWIEGERATDSEYQYLICWLNDNLDGLYNLFVKQKSYLYLSLEKKRKAKFKIMYDLLEIEIKEGRLSPIRYEINYSNLLH